MIATTIISSMSVKPRWLPTVQRFLFQNLVIAAPFANKVVDRSTRTGARPVPYFKAPVLTTIPDAYEKPSCSVPSHRDRRRRCGDETRQSGGSYALTEAHRPIMEKIRRAGRWN